MSLDDDLKAAERDSANLARDLRKPDRQHQRIVPAVYSHPDHRDAMASKLVLEQFHVEKSPRYQPRDGLTFCNIFMWDWSIAMMAELPHFVAGKELVINRTIERLRAGEEKGWHSCLPEDAHACAKTGMPAIATWYNARGGPGHVAVIEPEKKLTVAQAGRICGRGLSLSAAFGGQRLGSLEFWFHV